MANAFTAQEEGFEGAGLGRWESFGGWPLEVSADRGRSGTQSMKAVAGAADLFNHGVRISPVQGKPRSMSLWAYRSTSIRAQAEAEMLYFNAAVTEVLGQEYFGLTEWAPGAWTNYARTCSPPAGTGAFRLELATSRVVVDDTWALGDTLYYDDMVVEVDGVASGWVVG